MSKTISRIKLKQDPEKYKLKDEGAIRRVIFNGKIYTPDEAGQIDVEISFKNTKTLTKNVINYGDTPELNNNDLYIVKENDNKKFSGYSILTMHNGELIRLTTPTPLFETANLDFYVLLRDGYPRYLTWNSLYNDSIFTNKKIVRGKDVFGRDIEKQYPVYFCRTEVDKDTFETKPYIVYKETFNDLHYLVKQYVKDDYADGVLVINGAGTKCCEEDSLSLRNLFAASVEKMV